MPRERPSTPTFATAVAGDGYVKVTWGQSERANHYAIKRRIVASETRFWDQKTQIASEAHLFIDRNVLNGKAYQYQVVAINESGDSEPATTAQVTPAAQVQPDAMVRTEAEGALAMSRGVQGRALPGSLWDGYSGNDIYNVVGTKQERSLSVVRNSAAVYQVRVQNDGKIDDTIKVTAPASGGGWNIRYRDIILGTDITDAITNENVVGGGYRPRLKPGAYRDLSVTVTPSGIVPIGSVKEVRVKQVSLANAQRLDVVRTLTTVIQPEVQSVTWISLDAANPVTDNPASNAGGITGTKRYFPDRLTPTGAAQNRIRVRAYVPGVPNGTVVYFQGLDVDEPGTDAKPLDNNESPNGGDNRGFVSDNNGFIYRTPRLAGRQYSSGVTSSYATVDIPLSGNPGDNYRVAASIDKDILVKLTVNSTAGAPYIFVPSDNNSRIAGFPGAVSPTLYIWRRLHIEVDSMMAPTEEQNTARGGITQITRGANATFSQATLNINLRTGLGSPDSSLNLDSPEKRNGRFENGWIRIGSGTTSVTKEPLLGNGDAFVQTYTVGSQLPKVPGKPVQNEPSGSFDIPFTLTKGNASVGGKIVEMRPAAQTTFVLNGNVTADAFTGGVIQVAGEEFAVLGNTTREVIVAGGATLPFVLHDDDNDSMLPRELNVGSRVGPLYAPAYILPIVDGGGDISNNTQDVPFQSNLPGTEVRSDTAEYTQALLNAMSTQSQGNRSGAYGIAYVLFAYQPQTVPTGGNVSRGDGDPNGAEVTLGGVTENNQGSLVFVEVKREQFLGKTPAEVDDAISRTIAHEVGHQFGLPDRDGNLPDQIGLMNDSLDPTAVFNAEDLHQIRLKAVPGPTP